MCLKLPDVHTPEQRHLNMVAIRSVSTKPELKVRKALWRLGFRYRVNYRGLYGTPDVVLPKYRTAIFIHGCFWHGHKGCKYYTVPKTNTEFWQAKVARNRERDQEVWRKLEAKGWFVIIVWECQLKKAIFRETIGSVAAEIRKNGETLQQEQQNRRASREAYRLERKARKERVSAILEEIRRH